MHVTVPTWRSTGDVAIKADIMGGGGPDVGYENFRGCPHHHLLSTGPSTSWIRTWSAGSRSIWPFAAGMQEIFTYPWMDESLCKRHPAGYHRNPGPVHAPSPSERLIRSSLLPNLCKAVVKNERYFTDFSSLKRRRYSGTRTTPRPYDNGRSCPPSARALPAPSCPSDKDITTLFRRAKGVVEAMPRYTHMGGLYPPSGEKPGVGRHRGVAEPVSGRGAHR